MKFSEVLGIYQPIRIAKDTHGSQNKFENHKFYQKVSIYNIQIPQISKFHHFFFYNYLATSHYNITISTPIKLKTSKIFSLEKVRDSPNKSLCYWTGPFGTHFHLK